MQHGEDAVAFGPAWCGCSAHDPASNSEFESSLLYRGGLSVVATSREGHHSPTSGREVPHQRWDREQQNL
jgi:hypothetical protein